MSDIASIGHTNGVHSIPASSSVGSVSRAESTPSHSGTVQRIAEDPVRGRDRLEISDHAMLMDRLRQLPEVRMDRVEALREAIASGQYETSERIDGAIEALLYDILG